MSVDGWIDDGKKVFSFYTGFVGIGNAGGIEAVWGLRQLYGYAVSNHSLYVLTGSFFNPGPYSGYLAMILPVCLHQWLTKRGRFSALTGMTGKDGKR